jgi:hypothetical protein
LEARRCWRAAALVGTSASNNDPNFMRKDNQCLEEPRVGLTLGPTSMKNEPGPANGVLALVVGARSRTGGAAHGLWGAQPARVAAQRGAWVTMGSSQTGRSSCLQSVTAILG